MKFPEPLRLGSLLPEAQDLAQITISGISAPKNAFSGSLIVFFKAPLAQELTESLHAAAWIVPPKTELPPHSPPTFVSERPRFTLMQILQRLEPFVVASEPAEHHPTAQIHPSASVAPGVSIGAYAVIAANVQIGQGVQIGAHCVLDQDVCVDKDVVLDPHVHLYPRVSIGARTQICSHTSIGMPGFGFEFEKGGWQRLPHLAGVVVGRDCSIGSHVAIAAGVLEPTRIDDSVILDNHIQIAHNTHLKTGNALAACTGIAGSTTIEPYCQIGGGSMIGGHITIGPQVQLTGMSMVNKSLTEPGRYSSGWPVEPNAQWRRKVAALSRLPGYIKERRAQGQTHE